MTRDSKRGSDSRITRRTALGLLAATAGVGAIGQSVAAQQDSNGQGQSQGNQPWYEWEQNVDAGGFDLTDLGAVSTQANPAINNFAGDNLSIDDEGVLNAQDNSRRSTTVTVSKGSDGSVTATGPSGMIASGDNSQAVIQAAIDRIEELNGGKLYINEGTYELPNPRSAEFQDFFLRLTSNLTIEGSGSDTVLRPVFAGSDVDLEPLVLDGDGSSNLKLTDFQLKFDGGPNDNVIVQGIGSRDVNGAGCTNVLIDNVRLTGRMNGIQGRGWQNTVIVNCIGDTASPTNPTSTGDANADAISISKTSATRQPRNSLIANNNLSFTVNQSLSAGIEIDGAFGGGSVVANNIVDGFENGIELDRQGGQGRGAGVLVANNQVVGSTRSAIVNFFDNSIISNNYIEGGDIGIEVTGSGSQIVGNNINDVVEGMQIFGERAEVIGNNVKNTANEGIGLGGGAGNSTISNNFVDLSGSKNESGSFGIGFGAPNVLVSDNYILNVPKSGLAGINVVGPNAAVQNNYLNTTNTGIRVTEDNVFITGNYIRDSSNPFDLQADTVAKVNFPEYQE